MSDRIDAFVSNAHYAEHLRPILDALPDGLRGDMYAPQNVARDVDGPVKLGMAPNSSMPLLVGVYSDLVWARRPKVLVQHGAGQTYFSVNHGSYAGGPGHEQADLFLCPNERCADLERMRYPHARAVAVGCPKLDAWARIRRVRACTCDHGTDQSTLTTCNRCEGTGRPPATIAVTFHWRAFLKDAQSKMVPEAGTAFDTWRDTIAELARTFPGRVLGHGHPKEQRWLRPHWDEMGIEYVPRAVDLLARADCLVLDNSSLGFEWAALDRPTVWLRGADWRPDEATNHGLRFGERLPGPELGTWAVGKVDELVDAVNISMERYVLARAEVRQRVYGGIPGGWAGRAAVAVLDLVP